MPLGRINTSVFHRRLYAGELETVTLLKRRDDQKEGSVVALKLFECRRGNISKQGEAIQTDETAEHYVQWLIPYTELKRVGVNYLNVLDRIVDKFNMWWQPESPQTITLAIFDNYYAIDTVRIDPIAQPKIGIPGVNL